jgi:hypothetical protein
MPRNRQDETLAKDKSATLTRRTLFELAGLAVAATAISPALPAEKPLRSSVPARLRRIGGICNDQVSTYMSEAGRKALPDEAAEKTKQHILDTFAAMISGSELPPGRAALGFAKEYGGKEVATVVASICVGAGRRWWAACGALR